MEISCITVFIHMQSYTLHTLIYAWPTSCLIRLHLFPYRKVEQAWCTCFLFNKQDIRFSFLFFPPHDWGVASSQSRLIGGCWSYHRRRQKEGRKRANRSHSQKISGFFCHDVKLQDVFHTHTPFLTCLTGFFNGTTRLNPQIRTTPEAQPNCSNLTAGTQHPYSR